MTPEEQKKLDEQRRKREEELLLLLLLLLGFSVQQIASVRTGTPGVSQIRNVPGGLEIGGTIAGHASTLGELSQLLMTHGVREFAESMADAHLDAFQRFAPGLTPPDRDELIQLYTPIAIDAAKEMVGTLGKALLQTGGDVQAALDLVGYSTTNSSGIEKGIERNIVSASNAGTVDGASAALGGQLTGLRHVSVLDAKTTTICRQRDGLQLPVTDPYWLTGWPSLHFFCRSIIEPISGPFEPSTWRPTESPAPGFGRAPLAVLDVLRRQAAQAA